MTTPRHILVVDDDPRTAEFISLLLKRDGYSIAEAHSVDEGLEKFQSQSADLIIAGLVMPQRTGLDLLHSVRDAGQAVPVVLCTGSDRMTREQALQNGFAEFIKKPFELTAFVEVVRQVLDRRTVPDSTSRMPHKR